MAAASGMHGMHSCRRALYSWRDRAGAVGFDFVTLNILVSLEWSADNGAIEGLTGITLLPKHGRKLAASLLVPDG